MALIDLMRYYDEASRCSRCGFCQPTCPTYREGGASEPAVARGRNSLARGVMEGTVRLDAGAMLALDECLRCGACVSACFSGVRTDRIVAAVRTHHASSRFMAAWRPQALFMRHILTRRALLQRLARLAAWGRALGLGRLALALGRLGGPFARLARAESLVPRQLGPFFHQRLAPGSVLPALGQRRARVGYYAGCRTQLLYPELGQATVKVLRRLGCEVRLLPEPPACCGLPPYSYGQAPAARALVAQNLKALDALDVEWVVTETGSCYHFMKEYAHLYGQDPELGEAAGRVSAKVAYLSDVVARMGFPLAQPRWGRSVTWQDSCQLAHLQKLDQSPRQVLRALAGVDYREMDEAAWCCGGAGAYTLSHPEQSDPILARKLGKVAATQAQDLVVGCQSCYMQLKHGVRAAGMPVRVLHLAELLEEATRNLEESQP